MPARRQGPRLWLKPAEKPSKTRTGKAAVWVIKDDDGVRIVTGCPKEDRPAAEVKLAEYIAAKHLPGREQDQDPRHILVTDVLLIYAKDKVPAFKRPDKTLQRLLQLGEWWAGRALSDVNGRACRTYTAWRCAQAWKSAKPDVTGVEPRMVQASGVRRELEDLRAAINYHRKEGYCRQVIEVPLPEKGASRERYLERDEAARLLHSMWRQREMQRRHRGVDAGQVLPTAKQSHRHLARFLLVGIYTGTRAAAICGAAFKPTPGAGWVDLERGVFHRKAIGAKATKKRQPAVRLPDRLLTHIRRWATIPRPDGTLPQFVVEWRNLPVREVNKGFATAVGNTGLGTDVTPHVLRHTCASWLMQRGANAWDAANYLGMTEAMLQRVYGHHAQDYQAGIAGGRAKARAAPGLHDIFSLHYHKDHDVEGAHARQVERLARHGIPLRSLRSRENVARIVRAA
ncbi:tyrosine-type recombinase/integrase [Methylobacterium sp. Leaf85]|uniref:tyrosine-type recombinase/integrase n=1 Tax=Methylobacterium sp. Leaf85 TaxID=1736241 RepID=UPI0009EBEDD4|nr:tyrosine-type recombinase/integrase [Methylobacterium sp. Leaf85]